MDEQMIEQLNEAAEEFAYNPDSPLTRSGIDGATSVDPEEAFKAGVRWYAAHGVIAGKVAELTEQRNRLLGAISWIEPQFVNSKTRRDELFSRIRFCVADAARACPAALAPYPERRHE